MAHERFQAFTVMIANINRSIYRIKSGEMAEFNLRSSHVSCLYYLYKENSLTAKELCLLCDEDKANVSRALKYLEAEGYILCHSDKAKRYQSPFELTEKGILTSAKIAKKIDNILDYAAKDVSDTERAEFYRVLDIINRNLQGYCDRFENT